MTQNATHFKHFLSNHTNILIAASHTKKLDTLSAGVALVHICAQLGKQAKIFFPSIPPERLSFLDVTSHMQPRGNTQNQEAIIALGPLGAYTVSRVLYKPSHHTIPILHMTARTHPYESALRPLRPHTTLSISDDSACSISEIITRITKEIDEKLLTEEVATSLLAGIVASSNNFQDANIHPQTLFTAAYLISKKADNEKIVKHLYKTKSIQIIRLWGAAIAAFSYRDHSKVGWSILTEKDFTVSGANESHIIPILNELTANFAQANMFILAFTVPRRGAFALVHAPKRVGILRYAKHKNAAIENNTILIPLPAHNENNLKQATLALVEEIEHFL